MHPLNRYNQFRAVAFFKGNWQECRSKSCRRKKRCTGGPRGTFTRIGIPACMEGRPLPDFNAPEPDKLALEIDEVEGVCED